MQKSLLLLALVALSAAVVRFPKHHQLQGYTFNHFVRDHNKNYDEKEFQFRRDLFEKELEAVKAHNADPNKSWKAGINHMSDWTPEDYKRIRGYDKNIAAGYRQKRSEDLSNFEEDWASLKNLPKNVDWRREGVVSDVKDQGQCGSCWTFATAETLESHYAIKSGYLQDLSQQHVLDCVPNPLQCGGTGGCYGGTVELAYDTLARTSGGLASEWTYSYFSYYGKNQTCQFDSQKTPVQAPVVSYMKLPPNKYTPLVMAVANLGPIAISVDASTWGRYESGIFDSCNQTNPDIDHAVVLVGYGSAGKNTTSDYWLVRNSWGPKWGEQGYIRIRRTAEVVCGTDITPLDGTGCKGGPSEVTVCGTCGILFDSAYPVLN